MTTNRLAFVGDSLVAGTVGSFNSWVSQVREMLADLAGIGPLVSSGFIPAALSCDPWTYAGAWSSPATTDAWFKGWYALSGGGFPTFKYGAGSSKTLTLTLGATYRYPTNGLRLYFVDYTSGGNWSYRVNGGTWTNHGVTLANDNSIKSVDIVNSFASGDVIDIRGANSAGTSAGCAVIGHEMFYLAPGTSGLIVDNLGINGGLFNHACAATSGDPLAMLDILQPNLGVILSGPVNDVTLVGNTATYNTDLNTFYNRAHTYAPVGIVNQYEWSTNTSTQASYRAQAKTTAAAWSTPGKVKDIYDDLVALGITGYAATNAQGFIYDGTHPSQAGHSWIAERVYWFVRTQFLSVAANTDAFTLGTSVLGGPQLLAGAPGRSSARDTAGGTDTAARTAVLTASDTAGGTDSVSYIKSFAHLASDTAGGIDVAGRTTVTAFRLAASPLGGRDQLGGKTSVAAAPMALDTAGGTDVASAVRVFARSASDTAGGTDSASRTFILARTASDTAGGTDAIARAVVFSRSASDTAGGTDSSTDARVFARTSSDTAGGTDAASRVDAFARSVSDTAGGTDVATASWALLRSTSDTAGGSDTSTATRIFARSTSDTAGGTDSSSAARVFARSISDTAGGTDSSSANRIFARSSSDAAGGTDAATARWALLRSSSDTAGGTDIPTAVRAFARSGSDTAGGTDTATSARVAVRSTSDAAGGTDAATARWALIRSSADTAGGTDAASPRRTIIRTAADTANGTDAASAVGGNVTHNASDAAGGTDVVSRTLRLVRSVTDAAGGTDAASAFSGTVASGVTRIRVTFKNDQRVTFRSNQRATLSA